MNRIFCIIEHPRFRVMVPDLDHRLLGHAFSKNGGESRSSRRARAVVQSRLLGWDLRNKGGSQ